MLFAVPLLIFTLRIVICMYLLPLSHVFKLDFARNIQTHVSDY